MKRFFLLLLATGLMMTVTVACGNDNKKGGNTNGTSDKTPASSNGSTVGVTSGGMTSEELDAWGNVSMGFDTPSQSGSTSNEQTSTSNEETSSKTESQTATGSEDQTSNDKDEGFGAWAPIG